jgi:hypothetical protein
MANKVIIKVENADNVNIFTANFSIDMAEVLSALSGAKEAELIIPMNLPKDKRLLVDTMVNTVQAFGITLTVVESQVYTYEKIARESRDTKAYWKQRGYLEDVQSDEHTIELFDIAKDIDALYKTVGAVNDRLQKLSDAGVIAPTKKLWDVGIHHHSVKSEKGISGVLDYVESKTYETQVERWDKVNG